MSLKAQDLFNKQDFTAFNNELDKIQNKILNLSNTKGAKVDLAKMLMGPKFTNDVNAMDAAIKNFFKDLKVPENAISGLAEVNRDITQTGETLSKVKTDSFERGAQAVLELGAGAQKASQEAKDLGASIDGAASSSVRMADELQQLKTSTQYFFSLRNMINLFKRGVREAVDVIKELDAAMTETAVVTDYSVGDMWKKLPEYTANANALGATVKDMYKATTLYYQQGLNTEQAMGIANETMKMARIGGLEAADATDKMTAALRGFNMEINEASAQRVNDVYSNLAAKTASDTEELGTAMQRTASIAASAGMSFEGTAAFLAQAIETTREPAENLGTAMKTIVARFTELKKNPLEITEVDGEEVDYNKVDAALKSIGVSLKDTNGQFRNLDQVFLDISQRWNSLTQTQQRYVATTAAGSRQQSRFIAMMSNYDRTVELMSYANNSAGASNEQFGKTMESLEAKLNKLKNAWNEFLMGIMNDSMTKFVVDAGTKLLDILNSITDALSFGGKSGLLKSITSLTAAFIGLKTAGKLINWGVDKAGGFLSPTTPILGFGGGEKVSKTTSTIVNPIVAEIRQVVAAIKSQPQKTPNNQNNSGTLQQYKDSQTNLRNLLGLNDQKLLNGAKIDPQRTINYSQITDNLKGLSDTQQRQLLGTLPGLQQSMRGATLNLLKNNGISKDSQRVGQQITRDIIKGMNKGTISVEKGIDLLRNPQKWGQYFGNQFNEGNLQEISKAVTGPEFNKLVEEAQDKYAKAVYRGENADRSWLSEEEIAAKQKDFEKYAQRKLKNKAPIEEINYTKYDQLGDKIGQVGAGFATAGQSVQQFGVVLSNLGLEKAGALLMQVGSSISSLGMAFNGLGTILPKIQERFADAGNAAIKAFSDSGKGLSGAASGGGAFFSTLFGSPEAAIAAGVATAAMVAIAIHKYLEKEAKEAGEEVRKQFEEGFTKKEEKINSLEGYQDRFNELSKGVDQFGHNISLSNEDYNEYLTISRELQQLSPSLIAGYNAEGEAIIKKGAAIQDVIDKLKAEKQAELDFFTANTSINKLIGEFQTSDIYKTKSKKQIKGTEFGAFFNEKANIEALNNTDLDFKPLDAINQLTGWNLDSLNNLTTSQLQWLTQHYSDVIGLIEEENGQLDEEVKEGYLDAFANANSAIEELTTEGQPIIDAMQMWMGEEGLDAVGLGLGEEFATGFNQGLQGLMLTGLSEGWQSDEFKTNLRNYSKEWDRLAGESSKYNQILTEAKKVQDEYLDSIGETDAINRYQNDIEASALALEQLAAAQDTSTAAGQAFAEQCVAQANALRNYATEGALSLGEALNSLSDEFESARGAKERFDKALEGGDYYTAAEGFKGIIDTMLDEKNLGGNGSLAFWTGADELLGQEFVDNNSYKDIVDQVQKIQDCFADGSDGVIAFNDLLTEVWNNTGGAEGALAKFGTLGEDGFEFDFQNEDLAEFAELLGMSEDALASLIDKARQWVPMELGNPAQIRQALEAGSQSMIGQSTKDGKTSLYTAESAFRAEARKQGIRGDDYTQTTQDLTDTQNVKFLTVDSLSANSGDLGFDSVMKDIGLDGADKTLDNAVATLTQMGFSLEEQQRILTSEGIQLADGQATEDDITESYNEQAYALENPTVAGIAGDTSTIANAATLMLAQMGILTDQAKEDIEKATQKSEYEGYKTDLDKASTTDEHNQALQAAKDKQKEYQAWADALAASRGEDDPYVQRLRKAESDLQEWVKESETSWNELNSEAAKRLSNFTSDITNDQDSQFVNAHATDLEAALATGNGSDVVSLLQQWKTEGNLTLESMLALGQAINSGDYRSAALTQFLYETQKDLTTLQSMEFQPFTLEVDLEGQENIDYVKSMIGSEYRADVLLNAKLNEDQRIEEFLNNLNQEFGDGSEVNKSVLIEATAKLSGGDVEGAHDLLVDAFGEEAVQIEPELAVLTSGAVIDKEGLQTALTEQVGTLELPEAKIDTITATIETSFANEESLPQEHYQSDLTVTVDPDGTAQSTINGLTETETKTIDISPNFTGTWEKTITINHRSTGLQKNARGRNFSIPARHTLSFGSAAQGMNVPKSKKSSGSQITALVGEEGFEVGYIPSEQRSVIFGANGPEMTSFPRDTVIYPHKQSKEILRQGKGLHKNFGSFQYGKDDSVKSGGLLSNIGGSSSSVSSAAAATKKAAATVTNAANETKDATTDAAEAVEKVTVWWENIARRTEQTERHMEKNQKAYEKYIKELRSTLRKTGQSTTSGGGGGDNFIKDLKKYIKLNQSQLKKANKELRRLDLGTGVGGSQSARRAAFEAGNENIAQISYTGKDSEGKDSTVKVFADLSYYIKKLADGTYVVDQSAIDKISNRSQRKATAEAANKAIDERVSKRNKAQDNIEKAREDLEKFAQELYDTFFGWETSLTKIWNITQQIEEATARLDRTNTARSILDAQIASGLREADTETFQRELKTFQQKLEQQNDIIRKRQEAIEQAQKDVRNAAGKNDERVQLNQINEQLKADKTARTNIKKLQATNAKLRKKQDKYNKILNDPKAKKKDKEEAKARLASVKNRIALNNKQIKADKKSTLNTTQRTGLKEARSQLNNQMALIDKAQSFMTTTRNADGSISIDFDYDKFNAEKMRGWSCRCYKESK